MSQVVATGGDQVFDITVGTTDYRVHVFDTVGTQNFVVTAGGEVEYLVVAGGGGGGSANNAASSGGGAGGMLESTTTVTAQTYSVIIGGGGPGGTAGSRGTSGSNSSALGVTSIGGGGSGGGGGVNGQNGGSGGGAVNGTGGLGTAGQGNNGASSAGSNLAAGGGGKSAAGSDNAAGAGGGAGQASTITGTSITYAGGGGGASSTALGSGGAGGGGAGVNGGPGVSGTNGLGGGGGAGRGAGIGNQNGGAGGSGIVVIRYVLFPPPPPDAPWEPVTTVTIQSTDYTGDTVGTVRVVRGRPTVYADMTAGYATIQLLDKTGVGFTIDPADTAVITLEDSDGSPVVIFTGAVTDIDRELYDPGIAGTPAAITRVTAVGPLARLARRQVLPAGRAAEDDADRITALIEAGLLQTWEETPGTWATFEPAGASWDHVDPGYDPTLIAGPLFGVTALDPSDTGHNALATANLTSNSAQGILYETPDGAVGWDNADSRSDQVVYQPIPRSRLLADLKTQTSLSDIVNRVDVGWGSGGVTSEDPESLIRYGRWERGFDTILSNEPDAQNFADEFIRRHAFPLFNVDSVAIRVDGTPADFADAMLGLRINSPVAFSGLPVTLGRTSLEGYVEGLGWQVSAQRAELLLTVSDAALSTGAIRWTQVDGTVTWDDVSGSLEWQDARSI